MPAPIVIPFGPMEPDTSDLNSLVSFRARNVYPSKTGFIRTAGNSAARSAFISGGTFAGACLIQTGVGTYRVYQHQLVSATHSIRSYDSASFATNYTGTEVGTGFAAPDSGEYWRFAKFGNFLIAVQDNVDPQVLNWSSAGSFGALSGSPPRASGVFAIEDFVFLTGLASNRRKLQWSAIGDHTGWTVGTNLSDEQEFPDGGDICGISGGKSGFVIQKQAIRTYQFLPGDTTTIFEFSKVQAAPGCTSLFGWAAAGGSIFYYSEEGFYSIGPGGLRAIGAGRVDRYMLSKVTNPAAIIAFADPYNSRIHFWINVSGTAALVYDWQLDKWSEHSLGFTFPVDHIEGTGGGAQMVLGSGGNNGSLHHLNGDAVSADITTSEIQIFQKDGMRANIRGTRPLIDGSVSSVQVFRKEKLKDSQGSANSSTEETNGWFRYGSSQTSGAFHQFTITTLAGNTSTYHKGLQVDATPDGEA